MPSAALIAATLPGIASMSWLGLAMAPATRRAILERINRGVRIALALAEVEKRLTEAGNVATPSTSKEMREKVAGGIARWTRVIAAAGIAAQQADGTGFLLL